MESLNIITSKNNLKIKQLIGLQKYANRKAERLFTCEGIKEQEKLIDSDYTIEAVYFTEAIISLKEVRSLFGTKLPKPVYQLSPEVYEKIAYREASGGVVSLVRMKEHSLPLAITRDNPIYLVIEGIEKPGNIGAIFRTADGAGISGIILADERTDLYNPNAIRASLGCVFSVPVYIATNTECLGWLKMNRIRIFTTWLEASRSYDLLDYTDSCAIVLGTEADGISKAWVVAADESIIIPMKGKSDSLNVANSAAILMYEAMRQRGF